GEGILARLDRTPLVPPAGAGGQRHLRGRLAGRLLADRPRLLTGPKPAAAGAPAGSEAGAPGTRAPSSGGRGPAIVPRIAPSLPGRATAAARGTAPERRHRVLLVPPCWIGSAMRTLCRTVARYTRSGTRAPLRFASMSCSWSSTQSPGSRA